ncbi:MAG: YicC/YloC family endoribonuclease [Planctomycetota bacterium]|jgi:uncharacterized protein (TIGR00255 family)
MTGSGVARGPSELGDMTVEVRSVNGRALSVKMRIPPECQGLETALEAHLRSQFHRGTLTLLICLENPVRNVETMVDEELAAQVAQQLRQLAQKTKAENPTLGDVLSFPGVVSGPPTSRARTSWEPPKNVLALVASAAVALSKSRAEEGVATVADMNQQLGIIGTVLEEVKSRTPKVTADYREKLLKRVNEFLEGQARAMEDSDVIREVALFADRVDISEELQRLESHLEKATGVLADGGHVGRHLEFLLQEMLREANTVASKSPDTEIAHRIVKVKSCIDRLKEQAQNLE